MILEEPFQRLRNAMPIIQMGKLLPWRRASDRSLGGARNFGILEESSLLPPLFNILSLCLLLLLGPPFILTALQVPGHTGMPLASLGPT